MWIISNALMKAYGNSHCSQALEEEYLGDTCSDGEQSAQLSGNHTQLAYLPPDKMTAFSRLSRFGMTFRPLTESRGKELLTLYLAAFPVRTSAAQVRAQESKEADPACGNTWQELSVRYDRATHSWRTHLCLWDEALQWSSVTLPRWGMTASGVLFQHPTAERPMKETGSGCWVGTPTKSMSVPSARYAAGTVPTPRALAEGKLTGKERFPTPTAHNAKETNAPSEAMRNEPTLASIAGGHLNPMWVEWLMGWPLGWTDLKPLETDRFQAWQQQHGGY